MKFLYLRYIMYAITYKILNRKPIMSENEKNQYPRSVTTIVSIFLVKNESSRMNNLLLF